MDLKSVVVSAFISGLLLGVEVSTLSDLKLPVWNSFALAVSAGMLVMYSVLGLVLLKRDPER